MASILPRSSDTNAHPIDITSLNDVRRHLEEFDMSAEDMEKMADTFLHCTIKLEGIDTRAANLDEVLPGNTRRRHRDEPGRP